MKKRFFPAFLSFLSFLSILTGCGAGSVRQASPEEYVQTMDYHDGFNILQLTDIHWNSATQIGDGSYGCEGYIRKVIDETENHAGAIDLIEITGDTFMLANAADVRAFIAFMDEIGIPYAITWGNHDREGNYNPNWISRRFTADDLSLYTEVDCDDVHERGNYVVNLINADGSVAWQLFQLDSGASYRQGASDVFLTYDYIRQDQLDWLTAEHQAVGADVPGMAFYHIAQADNNAALQAYLNGEEGYTVKYFDLEDFCASDYAGFTEDVFLANHIVAAFMGHAHANDWTVTLPSGITYGLGVKTGTDLYYGHVSAGYADAGFDVTEDFDLIGASLITLNDTQGNFTLQHLYLNERDEGDFVMWVEY